MLGINWGPLDNGYTWMLVGEVRTAVLRVPLLGPTLLEGAGAKELGTRKLRGMCSQSPSLFNVKTIRYTRLCVLSKHLEKPTYKLVAFLLFRRRYNKLLKANFLTIMKID